jgi:putative spermidine/putrescine transport system permease protein
MTPAEPIAFDTRAERASWLQIAPLVVVLVLFFGLPMLVVLAVSFFDFDRTDIVPTYILDNYADLFRSEVTLRLYASSIKFALIVWA